MRGAWWRGQTVGRRGRGLAPVGVGHLSAIRVSFELESSFLQSIDDLGFGSERDDDIIGKVRRDEKDGSGECVNLSVIPFVRDETYIPAMARGVVRSSTRRPASRPSPNTCMTI